MVTRSGDRVVYSPTVTEPEALLDHQEGLLLRNRWQRLSSRLFPPVTLLDRILEVTTRLAQSSWARPGWVVSCDMVACPSAQGSVQDLAKTSGGILGFFWVSTI